MGLTRIRAEQISDIDYKQAVRVIQRTNITLSGGAPSSVDSVNLSANDRVLVSGQDAAAENGIYRVQTLGQGSNGTWVRTSDANADGEIEAGMIIMVTEGDVYKDTQWKLTTNNPIIIGTTPLTFVLNAVSVIGGENTQVQYNQSGVLAGSANLTFDGSSLTVGGNVTATYFLGDGSQLSGIITSVANINNGTSNVSIDEANADITMSVNGTANVVVVSATGVTVNGSITGNGIPTTTVANAAPANPESGDIWIDSDTGTQLIYFTSGGNSQWAEMEAYQSFSTGGGSDYGNANVVAYGETGWAGNIIPSANVTYSLGNTANRWQDIWLANSTIYLGEASISADDGAIVLPANTTVGGAVVSAVPKVTGFTYPGDDTAADPAGGQTILINGANFESGCIVYLDNAVISPVVFVSSSQLSFTSPAKATGTYSVYVVNPDGSTALALPGIVYSGVPTWSTAAGSLGTPYETDSFSTTLVATADSAVTYAASPGNTLPANLSLNSSTGNLTGTIPVTNNDTTYTFSVRATDAEQQDTDRQFSVTYKTDVVTWSAPANASSYTWNVGTANSVSMSATSAAGKSVSFAVQSGSLPANVTVSGNLITGTPTEAQSNTAVVIRATAATTNRFADQTFYFTTQVSGWNIAAPTLQQTTSLTLNGFGSIFFSDDGTKLFGVPDSSTISSYTLSSAFDLTTLSGAVRTFAPSGGGGVSSVFFNSDGTKMFVGSYSTKIVYCYTLGTAWNTDTASLSNQVSVSANQNFVFSVYVSPDGTKLYISGNGNGQKGVQRYNLATPYDLSTASFVNSIVVSEVSNMRKVFFKTDGTAMFVTFDSTRANSDAMVRKYDLGTAWDTTTASASTEFITYPSGANAFFPGKCGLWFNSTGTIMMLGSNESPNLSKYSL